MNRLEFSAEFKLVATESFIHNGEQKILYISFGDLIVIPIGFIPAVGNFVLMEMFNEKSIRKIIDPTNEGCEVVDDYQIKGHNAFYVVRAKTRGKILTLFDVKIQSV